MSNQEESSFKKFAWAIILGLVGVAGSAYQQFQDVKGEIGVIKHIHRNYDEFQKDVRKDNTEIERRLDDIERQIQLLNYKLSPNKKEKGMEGMAQVSQADPVPSPTPFPDPVDSNFAKGKTK